MFGFGKKQTTETEIHVLRRKQIESLRSFNVTVREIEKNTVFEVDINSTPALTLKICLPQSFPSSPPEIYVFPAVQHRWVDPQMLVTGFPKLQEWTAHSNLGKLVKELGQEFKSSPPKILPSYSMYPSFNQNQPLSTQNPVSSQNRPSTQNPANIYGSLNIFNYPTNNGNPLLSNSTNNSNQTHQGGNYLQNSNQLNQLNPSKQTSQTNPNSRQQQQPVEQNNFEIIPELMQLSTQELQDMMNDDIKLERFQHTLERFKDTENVINDLREENEKIAQNILNQEERVTVLKQLSLEENQKAREIQKIYEEKSKKLQDLMKNYSAPVIIGKMRVATQLAEEESEEIANLFVDGTSDVNSYIDNFILKRKLFHVRAAKLESVELDPNFFVTKS